MKFGLSKQPQIGPGMQAFKLQAVATYASTTSSAYKSWFTAVAGNQRVYAITCLSCRHRKRSNNSSMPATSATGHTC